MLAQGWAQLWELLCWPLAMALPRWELAPTLGAGDSENKTNPVLGEETEPLEVPGISGQLWSFLSDYLPCSTYCQPK